MQWRHNCWIVFDHHITTLHHIYIDIVISMVLTSSSWMRIIKYLIENLESCWWLMVWCAKGIFWLTDVMWYEGKVEASGDSLGNIKLLMMSRVVNEQSPTSKLGPNISQILRDQNTKMTKVESVWSPVQWLCTGADGLG